MKTAPALALILAMMPAGHAAGAHFGFAGWFGTYKRAEVRAGAVMFDNDCASCHAIGLQTPAGAAMSLFEAQHRNGAALMYRLLRGHIALPVAHPVLAPVPAHAIATYLAWTADPTRDQRKRFGAIAILFLIAFGAVVYFAFGTRTDR